MNALATKITYNGKAYVDSPASGKLAIKMVFTKICSLHEQIKNHPEAQIVIKNDNSVELLNMPAELQEKIRHHLVYFS